MKKASYLKAIALIFACVMVICALAVTAFADAEQETVEIYSKNVYYGDTLKLMFAVKVPEGASVKVTAKDSAGNGISIVPYNEYSGTNVTTVKGTEVQVFISEYGVAEQNIDEVVTVTATANGTSDTQSYSVLEYLYERLYVSANVTELQCEVYLSLLDYANKSDKLLNGATAQDCIANYRYVKMVNCNVLGNDSGTFYNGSAISFTSDIVAGKKHEIAWKITVLESGSVNWISKAEMESNGLVITEHVSVEAVAVEHECTFGDWVTTKEPTCTEDGEQMRTCECGMTETQPIDATGHTEITDAAVEPTCTETGLTEGKHCDVCGEVLVAQIVVSATGHTEIIDVAVEPTCTETGLTEGKHCDVCGEVLVAQIVVSATGHTEIIDSAVAPTCTETGLTEGKHCDVCGQTLVEQETVSVLDHAYNDENTCTVCGDYADKGVIFTLVGNEYSITGYTGSATEIIIPSTYKGKPITSIGREAFFGCYEITSIKFGANSQIKTIGESSLDACGFTTIEIPASVISIANAAFHCSELTSVTFEENSQLTSIGSYAFYFCDALKSIEIPRGVTSIGDQAFYYCYSFSTVYYEGTKAQWDEISIGSDNDYLTNATIICSGTDEETDTETDTEETTEPSVIEHVENVQYALNSNGDGYTVYGFDDGLESTVHIRDTINGKPVTAISKNAFKDSGIVKIYFGTNIKTIGTSAFGGCENVSIYFGGSNTDWAAISKTDWNVGLGNYSVHLNSTSNWEIPIG